MKRSVVDGKITSNRGSVKRSRGEYTADQFLAELQEQPVQALHDFNDWVLSEKDVFIVSELLDKSPELESILSLFDYGRDKKTPQLCKSSDVYTFFQFICLVCVTAVSCDDQEHRNCVNIILTKVFDCGRTKSQITLLMNQRNTSEKIKTCVRLLALAASMNESLATETLAIVLNQDSIWKGLLNRRNARDPEDVRATVIAFVCAILQRRKNEDLITKISSPNGLLHGCLMDIQYDTFASVMSLCVAMKKTLLQNVLISKSFKIKFFSPVAVRNLCKALHWSGPEGWKSCVKHKSNHEDFDTVMKPPPHELVIEIRKSVGDLLLMLLTSSKHGIKFHDQDQQASSGDWPVWKVLVSLSWYDIHQVSLLVFVLSRSLPLCDRYLKEKRSIFKLENMDYDRGWLVSNFLCQLLASLTSRTPIRGKPTTDDGEMADEQHLKNDLCSIPIVNVVSRELLLKCMQVSCEDGIRLLRSILMYVKHIREHETYFQTNELFTFMQVIPSLSELVNVCCQYHDEIIEGCAGDLRYIIACYCELVDNGEQSESRLKSWTWILDHLYEDSMIEQENCDDFFQLLGTIDVFASINDQGRLEEILNKLFALSCRLHSVVPDRRHDTLNATKKLVMKSQLFDLNEVEILAWMSWMLISDDDDGDDVYRRKTMSSLLGMCFVNSTQYFSTVLNNFENDPCDLVASAEQLLEDTSPPNDSLSNKVNGITIVNNAGLPCSILWPACFDLLSCQQDSSRKSLLLAMIVVMSVHQPQNKSWIRKFMKAEGKRLGLYQDVMKPLLDTTLTPDGVFAYLEANNFEFQSKLLIFRQILFKQNSRSSGVDLSAQLLLELQQASSRDEEVQMLMTLMGQSTSDFSWTGVVLSHVNGISDQNWQQQVKTILSSVGRNGEHKFCSKPGSEQISDEGTDEAHVIAEAQIGDDCSSGDDICKCIEDIVDCDESEPLYAKLSKASRTIALTTLDEVEISQDLFKRLLKRCMTPECRQSCVKLCRQLAILSPHNDLAITKFFGKRKNHQKLLDLIDCDPLNAAIFAEKVMSKLNVPIGDVGIWLRSYTPDLRPSNRAILKVIRLFETVNGTSVLDCNPFRWKSCGGSTINSCFNEFDSQLVVRSIHNYPDNRKMAVGGAEEQISDPSAYDPLFVLPLLYHAFSEDSLVYCEMVWAKMLIAYCCRSLSSYCQTIRTCAYLALCRFIKHAEDQRFTKRQQMLCFLRRIRNSCKSLKRIPVYMSLFLAKCCKVMFNTESPMFDPVNRYLLRSEIFRLNTFPQWSQWFMGDDLNSVHSRKFIVDILSHSLVDHKDFRTIEDKVIPDLLAVGTGPEWLLTQQERELLFMALCKAVENKAVLYDLINNHCFVAWLNQYLFSYTHGNHNGRDYLPRKQCLAVVQTARRQLATMLNVANVEGMIDQLQRLETTLKIAN